MARKDPKRPKGSGRRPSRAAAPQLQVEWVPPGALNPAPYNPRKITEGALARLRKLLKRHGWAEPLVAQAGTRVLIGGHQRLEAAKLEGITPVPVVFLEVTDRKAKALNIALNNREAQGTWDEEALAKLLDELGPADLDELTGFTDEELEELLHPVTLEPSSGITLAERFGAPPFSVLDARQGYWRRRAAAWHEQIGQQANHRGAEQPADKGELRRLVKKWGKRGPAATDTTQIARFDPVLVELAVRWFSPQGGTVLDPFAGTALSGVVASLLGRRFLGVDLSAEQVASNQAHWAERAPHLEGRYAIGPAWLDGDSRELQRILVQQYGEAPKVDLVLSCPPYFDLERYTDSPACLANSADWGAFLEGYLAVLKACAAILSRDAFVVLQVGNLRTPKGVLRDLAGETVIAMRAAGLEFWNDAILVQPAGTLPVRVRQYFKASRKLGRMHQQVLVFTNGDPRAAAKAMGPAECGTLPGEEEGQGEEGEEAGEGDAE